MKFSQNALIQNLFDEGRFCWNQLSGWIWIARTQFMSKFVLIPKLFNKEKELMHIFHGELLKTVSTRKIASISA